MIGEIDIHGVFVPALLLSAIAAFALSALLRRVLAALGLYRFVWHRSLFDMAMLVIILGGITAVLRTLT
jgi:hypothetical protein